MREAAYEGDVHAIYCYALECRDPEQRKRWLKQAAEAENVDAMYTYSQECEDPTEAEYWLTKTAVEGHAQAMYEYAMRCDDLAERRWWLTCAAPRMGIRRRGTGVAGVTRPARELHPCTLRTCPISGFDN